MFLSPTPTHLRHRFARLGHILESYLTSDVLRILAFLLVAGYAFRLLYLFFTDASSFGASLIPTRTSPVVTVMICACFAAMTAYGYMQFGRRLRIKSVWYLVIFVIVSALGGWVTYPVNCSRTASFVLMPERSCTCVGMTFLYAPNGTPMVPISSIVLAWNDRYSNFNKQKLSRREAEQIVPSDAAHVGQNACRSCCSFCTKICASGKAASRLNSAVRWPSTHC